MADALVAQITPADKAVILNVRSWEIQPWAAGDAWTDLRCGFFASLTKPLDDDDQTGLDETIANPGFLGVYDRFWLGIGNAKQPGAMRDPRHPGEEGIIAAFTNTSEPFPGRIGGTQLISSDAGIGAGTTFWRPTNTANPAYCATVYQGRAPRARLMDNAQIHFPQNPVGAGGYAVLLAMQMLRDSPQSNTVRFMIKAGDHSADMLYSDTPTLAVLQAALEDWPDCQQMGPVTLSAVPTAFYFYWPFRSSRLRIHSYGVLDASP